MSDTILLLGASQDQLAAIHTAKRMGIRTLVVDRQPDAPGFALADEAAAICTKDTASLKALCDTSRARGYPVDGVLVMGSDIPQVVAELAEYLGVIGPTRETARLATHKRLMKECFAANGIPIPWFKKAESAAQVHEFFHALGRPLVIKPVDRAGSRGVARITTAAHIDQLFAEAEKQSLCGEVLVEEYLEGLQISTETLVWKGKGHTVGFADRNYEMLERFAPRILENGGAVPSSVSPAQRRAVESIVERAAMALGITDGVAKGDIVLTAEGPKVIEMAARLSGGDFSETLIPLGCGVDIIEAAISIAIGRPLDISTLKPCWSRAVINRYFFPPPGRLRAISGIEEVAAKDFIRKLQFWYKPGDLLPEISSHGERFGVFIVEAESVAQAEQYASWVYSTIKIVKE